MRINGRTLRPSDLSERSLMLKSFGTLSLRVPRGSNPFLIARKLRRAAHEEHPAVLFVKERLKQRRPKPMLPLPSPEADAPEPMERPVENADGEPSHEAA